jgi:DtxR family manganese transport transcriptional regulator
MPTPPRTRKKRPGAAAPAPGTPGSPDNPARRPARRVNTGAQSSARGTLGGTVGGSEGVAAAKADHHRRTRKAHANELTEDYVEMIADLIAAEGEARVVDLARGLGVSHVTVVRTISRLQRDGLVSSRPYRSIFLTDDGRRLAERVRARHATVVAVLRALGVSEEAAHADAEGIEHHVSRETLAAFERFVQRR